MAAAARTRRIARNVRKAELRLMSQYLAGKPAAMPAALTCAIALDVYWSGR